MKKIILSITLAAAAAVALVSCNKENTDPNALTAYEQSIKTASEKYIENVVYATYGSLATAGNNLYQDLLAMKQGGIGKLSQAAIDKACADFLSARSYWEASEAFLYGAATDFSIDPHIDSWPLDPTRLANNLRNTATVADLDKEGAGAIDEVGASALGFHGIEFILFRDGANRKVADFKAEETAPEFVGTGVTGEQEIIFATAVAEDLRNHLYQLNVSWNPKAPQAQKDVVEELEMNCTVNGTDRTYGENFLAASAAGSTYASWQEVAKTVLDAGCANIANEVFSTKMGQAYSGEDESYIESPYSKKSFADFKDNILSIQYSLYGSYGANTAAEDSFQTFLTANHPGQAAKLSSALAGALKALDACLASGVAFVDNPSAAYVGTAIDAISVLNDALEEAAAAIAD